MKQKLFESGSFDPAYNLAVEELLMRKKPSGEVYFFLWQNDKTVVLGKHQNAYEEVNLAFAKARQIKVIRRNSGGGAVYHDKGNINFSMITDRGPYELQQINKWTRLACDILAKYKILAKAGGRNDIFVKGKKISGAASYYSGGRVLFHGTLLVGADLAVMRNVLTRNNKITDSMGEQSVPNQTGNLCEFAKEVDVAKIKAAIRSYLYRNGVLLCDGEMPFEQSGIGRLIREKYGRDAWNYGYQPEFNYKSYKKFRGGNVCVDALVEHGQIQAVEFRGDFFTYKDIKKLEKNMEGMRLSKDFPAKLKEIGADGYLVDISAEDLAELFQELFWQEAK